MFQRDFEGHASRSKSGAASPIIFIQSRPPTFLQKMNQWSAQSVRACSFEVCDIVILPSFQFNQLAATGQPVIVEEPNGNPMRNPTKKRLVYLVVSHSQPHDHLEISNSFMEPMYLHFLNYHECKSLTYKSDILPTFLHIKQLYGAYVFAFFKLS